MATTTTNNNNSEIARLEHHESASKGYWIDAWFRLTKNRAAVVGLVIIVANVLVAIFAPFITPEGIDDQKTEEANAAPEWVMNLFPILDPRDESFPTGDGEVLVTTGQSVQEGALLVDYSSANLTASVGGTVFVGERRFFLLPSTIEIPHYPVPANTTIANLQNFSAGDTLFADVQAPFDAIAHLSNGEVWLQPNTVWRKDRGEVLVENLQQVEAGATLIQTETGAITAPFAGTVFVTRNNVELALIEPLRFSVPEGQEILIRDGRELTAGTLMFGDTRAPITGDAFIQANEIIIRQTEQWLIPETGLEIANLQQIQAGERLLDYSDRNVYANMDGTVFVTDTAVQLSPLEVARFSLSEIGELTVTDGQAVAMGTQLFGNTTAQFDGVVYLTDSELILRPNSSGYTPLRNKYLLGADYLGRDMWSRLAFGAQVSLLVALIGPLVSLMVGLPYGLVSGFFGGAIDNWMMRFVDLMYAFPTLLLIILLMAFFRSSAASTQPGTFVFAMGEVDRATGGMFFIFLGVGLTSWMGLARLTRGQVLSAREQEYVVAARALGQSVPQILTRHILPNILGPIVIAETLTIPTYISYEAFLSFIGLGVNAPQPSWGIMISDGARVLRNYPHEALFPALALFLIMFAFNFLGDGLRDALDPRLRGVD